MPESPLRVLITGSRYFTDRKAIAGALHLFHRENPGRTIVVVHGVARGADSVACGIARDNPGRLVEEAHPADWRNPDGTTNRAAGFIRNQKMVTLGADICLAFLQTGEKNAGTRDCIRRAEKAGITVRQHWS